MKRILVLALVVFCSGKIYAQTPAATGREISGIVKDSADNAVVGAIVVLSTPTDSVKKNTNANGVFVFKDIKTGQFTVSVRSIGYQTYNKRFLFNDGTSKLILDPIVLKETSNLLNTVTINGTPPITYKGDTTEYRAKDYVVKPNSSVEDLIKKMEGVEVANDGTVTHQGITVTRAKLNGKVIGGNDLANTIKNLPADIVEKIQMVDDYGDQAARTGIKDGDPDRVLNIVTRADRSVGNRLAVTAGAGNNDRYTANANLSRLNGKEHLFVRGNLNNTITGVASNGYQSSGLSTGNNRAGQNNNNRNPQNNTGLNQGGGTNSGGLSTAGGTAISYSDKWSKKLEVNGNYSYSGRDASSVTNSTTNQTNRLFGNVFIKNDADLSNSNQSHNLTAQIKIDIDSANFLQISPSFGYSDSKNANSAIINMTQGIRQDRTSESSSDNTSPNYGLTVLYSHNFARKGRVASMQFTVNSNENEQDRIVDNHYKFYNRKTEAFIRDSTANLSINNNNDSKNYRISVTFSEPLSLTSRLEFNGQISKRDYDNSQITDRFVNGVYERAASLSKIYNYSFTEQRYAVNYRYLKGKYNVSLGVTAVPGLLTGFSESLNRPTNRASLNVIPIARAEYQWSRLKRFNIHYSGHPNEPSFDQVQDVEDPSNPLNPVIGNPELKAQFRHTVTSGFNNYIPNSKLNFSMNFQGVKTNNKVIRNTVEIDTVTGKRATYFINANGDYSANGNYNITKQFANRKYHVGLNGTANFSNSVSMISGLENVSKIWSFSQRLGIQLYPTQWFEFIPNIRYDYLNSSFSLRSQNNSKTSTWAISTEGRVDFMEGFFLNYNFSKNYVQGINANVSSNPFIINTSLSKDLFKKKGTLQIQAFDLLNQNNFIIRNITENAITDVRSNALSRYFMVNFTLRLQKWTGAPQRGGRPVMRRGDGSFID